MSSSNDKIVLELEANSIRYMDNKDKIKKLEDHNKALTDFIIEELDSLNTKSYSFTAHDDNDKPHKYTFTKAERSKVIYDNEKLKEVVGKKTYSKIVDREFIADWDKLVVLAKKYSINKEELLDCLTINEKINNNKLKELYEIGEVDLKALKGTFTIDSSVYLSVRES